MPLDRHLPTGIFCAVTLTEGVSCAHHIEALTGAFDDCPGDTPELVSFFKVFVLLQSDE
jgi:hypothetical protein